MAAREAVTSSQSPIDLGPAIPGAPTDLVIKYGRSIMHGHDVRTTLEFPVAGGSAIRYGGIRYELEQFHFHTPSEHAIDGEYASAEIHFVHSDGDGNKAVLAVFADESDTAEGPRRIEQAVSLFSLLPESVAHYAYEGSLTTPPFSEGVVWIVLTDRVALRPEWIDAFRDRYGANNRALQPLNGRLVELR